MSASFRGPGKEKLRSLFGAVATADTTGLAAAASNRKEAAPGGRERGRVLAAAARDHRTAVPSNKQHRRRET